MSQNRRSGRDIAQRLKTWTIKHSHADIDGLDRPRDVDGVVTLFVSPPIKPKNLAQWQWSRDITTQ